MNSGTAVSVKANALDQVWADIREEALAALDRVGSSGWWILGSEVEAFERDLASAAGRKWAIGCASGLDALEIAIRASGLGAGDKIVTTPLSAFATTLAIIRSGATPVFVDVDRNGLLDLSQLATAADMDKGIRGVVPVHLYGRALDLDSLSEVCAARGLHLIEDCAQAFGATYDGKQVGSVGQMAAVSLYPTKNLGAMGDGGFLLTDREDLANTARSLRDYGQSAKYVHDKLGMNSRLDEVHAAILRDALLPRLSGYVERRRAIAQKYGQGIKNPLLELPVWDDGHVWHLYPVVVSDADHFTSYLASNSIQSGRHYPVLIPDQEALAGTAFTVAEGGLSGARRLAAGEVSLPIHPYMKDDEVELVIEVANAYS